MTSLQYESDSVSALDAATLALVRLSAAVVAGSEAQVRAHMAVAARETPHEWVEELVLQSYLFAGFPRGLNAAREWRKISGRAAPRSDEGEEFERAEEWARRGEETCATVYGEFYEGLRRNIRALHPALDAWMIVEGYGKVLGRPQLELRLRELCIVAACAAARQDRQLHSHLHGALNAGATESEVGASLAAVEEMLEPDEMRRYAMLWARVKGK